MRRRACALSVGFPPIADARARVLVLGSLPGVKSLEMREYYAQPYNAFWRIMGELFGAGPELAYAARLARLRAHGIAVWDVLAAGEREGSLDSAIVPASIVVNDFNAFFERHRRIGLICFNGNTAAGAVPAQGAAGPRAGVGGHRAARAAVDEPGLREPALRAEARALGGRARHAVARSERYRFPCAADYAAARQDKLAWLKPTTVGSIALASRRTPRARACSRFMSRVIATPTRSRGARRSTSAACSSTAAARAPEQPLAAGDELEFHRPPWREPEAPESFAVAFEDEHVLVVVKPADLQVLPAGPFSARTLLELVRSSDASRARGGAGAPARPRHVGPHRVRQDGARPLVAEPPAARAHARQDVSRVDRRRALADVVRGAAADRARAARPADDPRRGGARAGVADARARAAPHGRAHARRRAADHGPARSDPHPSRRGRRADRRRSAVRAGRRAEERRAAGRRRLLAALGGARRSTHPQSGARIRLRSRPDWLAELSAE